jgi:membrane protein implicated in regulation of membrane protease activity
VIIVSGAGSRSDTSSSTRPIWLVVCILLAVGIVLPLWVTTFDTEDPSLWGFPFFYWYQFLLIPVVSVLTYVAFKLSQRATERERTARGLPPRADEAGDRP